MVDYVQRGAFMTPSSSNRLIASVPGLLVLTLLVGGCGGSMADASAPFAGRWTGTVAQAFQGQDVHVTANLRPVSGSAEFYDGDISTDATRCFTSAMLTATVTNGSLRLSALGSGNATQTCTITITGDAGDAGAPKFTGLFRMLSTLPDDCNVDPATPFTFVQQ
jgi:hypothetical protein